MFLVGLTIKCLPRFFGARASSGCGLSQVSFFLPRDSPPSPLFTVLRRTMYIYIRYQKFKLRCAIQLNGAEGAKPAS